jgi:hypothetical protein
LDGEGLERLELAIGTDGITASSTVLGSDGGGFQLQHRWHLCPGWRVKSAEVERWNSEGHGRLRLDRVDGRWHVDGLLRPDLDDAGEPDLSVTPFCNTFPIRRTPTRPGEALVLDTAFIDGLALTVTASRQCYVRQGPQSLRYIDQGLFAGFEADLTVDAEGLVQRYSGLFERVLPNL